MAEMDLAYLDNAASEPLHPRVRDAMLAALDELGGLGANPSSPHAAGRHAAAMLEQARSRIAAVLGASPVEVVFTGGGTEAVALAVRGIALGQQAARNGLSPQHLPGRKGSWAKAVGLIAQFGANPRVSPSLANEIAQLQSQVHAEEHEVESFSPEPKGPHPSVAYSAVEHDAVRGAARTLRDQGFREEILAVDADGVLRDDALDRLSTPPTLISVMAVNNENGVIQPIAQLVEKVRAKSVEWGLPQPVPVFTDAIQAVGRIPVDFDAWGVSAISIAGHKLGGPVNTGALIIRRETPMRTDRSGSQERTIRGGTQDVIAALGLAEAVELAETERENRIRSHQKLREALLQGTGRIEGVRVATQAQTTPGIIQLLLADCEPEALIFSLDRAGVCVSAGAACHTGVARPSNVLLAQGYSEAEAFGTLRISFGWNTTQRDIDRFLAALPEAVELSRKLHARARV